MRLHDINEAAVFAWSDDALPLIASGTLAGVMDDTFSSASNLSIYSPFQEANNDSKSLSAIYSASAPGKFSSIAWKDDTIAAGLETSTIQLYNSKKILTDKPSDLIAARIVEYTKHTTPVLQVKFNPLQPHILASSASKGEIFIWDTNKNTSFTPGQPLSEISKISSLSWNNSKSHIFGTAGDSNHASIWDLKAKREVLQLSYTNINLSSIQWHPNQSTKLITASNNDIEPIILTWDLRNSSTPEKILKGHKKGILSIDWCKNDPNLLLSSGKDDFNILWNPIDGTQLASYPSANWNHQIKFAPKIPEFFATSSLSKKIQIKSLQDTNNDNQVNEDANTKDENDFWNEISTTETKQHPTIQITQAPAWLKRPISAQFAYGGKLVISKDKDIKIVNISNKDSIIDSSAKKIISAIASNNYDELFQLKDDEDWNLLKKSIENSSIESILDLSTESTDDIDDKLLDDEDDEDFFNQISKSKKVGEFTKFIPQGEFNLDPVQINDDFEKKAIDLLLTKKDDELLDYCIENNHIMEALIISMNLSNNELKEKAKNSYFEKFAQKNSFSRLLYSSSNNSISDIVKNGNINSWKQIAKSIINFSEANTPSFNVEMKLLGDRLLDSNIENSRKFAISCYLVSNSIDKISKLWLSELSKYEDYYLNNKNEDGSKNSSFEARFKALGEIIEKVIIFQSKSKLHGDLSELSKVFIEYCDSLVNFGHYELAYKLLNMISDDSSSEIKIERNRIETSFLKKSTVVNTPTTKLPSAKYGVPQSTLPITSALPAKQEISTPSTTKKRNPYVLPNATSNQYQPPAPGASTFTPPTPLPPSQSTISSPKPAAANPYQPFAATGISSANPYKPSYSSNPASSPLPPQAAVSGNPFQPASTPSQSFSANPYAPKTALDSLKNSSASPVPAKKENVPSSFKKDVGGWNDLPSHLAPVVNTTSLVPPPANPFANQHNRTSSTNRNISQALAMPPPPLRSTTPTTPSPPVQAQSRVSSTKNPYVPKPEVFQPPTVPVAQSPLARPTEQMPPTASPVKLMKNPYAPKPQNNQYAPPIQQQQPSSNGVFTALPPQNQFNGSAAPPPPNYGRANIPPPPPAVKSTPPPPPAVATRAPPPPAASSVGLPPAQNTVASPPASTMPAVNPQIEEIISLLTSELNSVKPKVPEKFNKHILDSERRINILFKHLRNNDLLTVDTINKVSQICNFLKNADFENAKLIKEDIVKNHAAECGDWMIGVNRLIGISEAMSN